MSPTENWRPAAAAGQLRARARLLRDIREYFSGQAVMEVETPLISSAGNPDPEIESIKTVDGGYLRTSPEFPLKRLLAAGSGDIFEMGRVFRAGESGRSHNPEFTLLEWYRNGFSYHRLMDEVAALVRHCGHGKFDHWPQQKLSYQQLFLRSVDLDPFKAGEQELCAKAKKYGIDDIELDRRQWLDLLISVVIQAELPVNQLTFVYDFPADQAALSRVRPGEPPVAERFELYLGRTELANGYQELTDGQEQRRRFEAENAQRENRGQVSCEVDHHLLEALESGMPECAGVALGVDRLLMAIVGAESIDEVTAFPFSRA
jgi:lysyl-tRNA synthetase class 2